MPARQLGTPRQQCTGAISAFVDGIDSHIILRIIRESKMIFVEFCLNPGGKYRIAMTRSIMERKFL